MMIFSGPCAEAEVTSEWLPPSSSVPTPSGLCSAGCWFIRAPPPSRCSASSATSAPDELTAYTALLHTPDGMPVVGVIPCYCGELAEGERSLKSLRGFGSPVLDTIQPLSFPAMQSILDAFFLDGNHNYWKSSMQQELSDAISVIVDHANRM